MIFPARLAPLLFGGRFDPQDSCAQRMEIAGRAVKKAV
jgi:hypothetical protein